MILTKQILERDADMNLILTIFCMTKLYKFYIIPERQKPYMHPRSNDNGSKTIP